MTQRPIEDIVTYRNRASNFANKLERFHAHLLDEGYKINTAKSLTNGIRQLFRYYQMDIKVRSGSSLNRVVKTQRSFPLTIKHVRRMYDVANFRERVIKYGYRFRITPMNKLPVVMKGKFTLWNGNINGVADSLEFSCFGHDDA